MDDDVLSRLLTIGEERGRISDADLLDNVGLLLLAGHETTLNLIGNGVVALLHDRSQMEMLRADASLDLVAADELLRFDSPVQFSRRVIITPTMIGAHHIEPREFVLTGFGAGPLSVAPLTSGDPSKE